MFVQKSLELFKIYQHFSCNIFAADIRSCTMVWWRTHVETCRSRNTWP